MRSAAPPRMWRKIIEGTHGEAGERERRSVNPAWLLMLGGAAIMLEGCRAIGDIFRAGAFIGVVGVILFVALVIGLIRLLA